MAFAIILGLDNELPLMVWADVTVLYPHDYVRTSGGRTIRASENRVQRLVTRALQDVRRSLKKKKARDYLAIRTLVIRQLCEHYGFVFVPSAKRTIIAEEVEDVVVRSRPKV